MPETKLVNPKDRDWAKDAAKELGTKVVETKRPDSDEIRNKPVSTLQQMNDLIDKANGGIYLSRHCETAELLENAAEIAKELCLDDFMRLYENAAVNYEAEAKDSSRSSYTRTADSYSKAAEIYEKLKSNKKAVKMYKKAARFYTKVAKAYRERVSFANEHDALQKAEISLKKSGNTVINAIRLRHLKSRIEAIEKHLDEIKRP